jgi:hypothetical protein
MKSISIPLGDIMAKQTLEVEIQVTRVRWTKFRLWLGSRIIKLGARIIGCGIEFKEQK